jgi:hypothetical protein
MSKLRDLTGAVLILTLAACATGAAPAVAAGEPANVSTKSGSGEFIAGTWWRDTPTSALCVGAEAMPGWEIASVFMKFGLDSGEITISRHNFTVIDADGARYTPIQCGNVEWDLRTTDRLAFGVAEGRNYVLSFRVPAGAPLTLVWFDDAGAPLAVVRLGSGVQPPPGW